MNVPLQFDTFGMPARVPNAVQNPSVALAAQVAVTLDADGAGVYSKFPPPAEHDEPSRTG